MRFLPPGEARSSADFLPVFSRRFEIGFASACGRWETQCEPHDKSKEKPSPYFSKSQADKQE